MKIAICDDEATVLHELSCLLEDETKKDDISVFDSAEELLGCDEVFDLVFLDIMMKGIDGIAAARQLRSEKRVTSLVFITGSKEYMLEAFDLGALHYLIKPIDVKKLKDVLDRSRKECFAFDSLKNNKICINTKQRSLIIEKSELHFAESFRKKLIMHTASGEIEYYGRIRTLEEELGEPFFRCHRSYIVNLAYIRGYDGKSITLTTGDQILLSRDRYAQFAGAYLRYLRNGGVILV